MILSKRPKGPEITDAIREALDIEGKHHESRVAHPRIERRVKQLESDLALLMDHLKLEFRDTPAQPTKRIVGKARKPKKPNPYVPISTTAAQAIAEMQRQAETNMADIYGYHY
jgi:hypothetical protein